MNLFYCFYDKMLLSGQPPNAKITIRIHDDGMNQQIHVSCVPNRKECTFSLYLHSFI